MFVEKINLSNYRNIQKLNLKLSPHINVLFGENAQGKTNIIESIFFLSSGRSFRPYSLKNLIGPFYKKAIIEATIVNKEDEVNLIRAEIENNRMFYINNTRSYKKHYDFLKTVIFSPDSLRAIKDSNETRRTLIDDALSGLGFEEVYLFNKMLKEKNCLS